MADELRELDALIAEKLYGWKSAVVECADCRGSGKSWAENTGEYFECRACEGIGKVTTVNTRNYSTDSRLCFDGPDSVVAKMRNLGFDGRIDFDHSCTAFACTFDQEATQGIAARPSLPEAVCLAAKAALESK